MRRTLTRRNLTAATRPHMLRGFTCGSAAWLLAALCLFGGCALPKGQAPNDQKAADGGPSDSGVRDRDAATAGKGPRASGSGGAGGTGGTAAGSGGGKAVVVQPPEKPAPAKPKALGDACASSADCASGNCKKGPKGDKRCYGDVARGRDCNGEFDCDGYACVPRKHGETRGVCIDTSGCTQDTCQLNHALAYCQLDQKCTPSPMDFVQCYQDGCAGDGDTDAGCAEESVEQRLNESGCCPPNGASAGACGVSPQCGCDDDEKCDSLRDGSTACGPVGSTPEGAVCMKDAECPKGFTCRGRVCKRYCDGFDDESCANGACIQAAPNGQVEPGIFFCVQRCDPTAPTTASDQFVACGAGQSCEPASDGNSSCFATKGTATQGEPCPDDPGGDHGGFKCAPGYACMVSDDTCAKHCRVQDNDCTVGTCNSFGPSKRYAGGIEIGYCK